MMALSLCWSSCKGALIPGPYGQCMTSIARETLVQNFKIRGGPMCKFSQDLYICLVALDTICGFNVSSKNKQTAHNQVYIRQIGLRPSQHMLVLPSVQSA